MTSTDRERDATAYEGNKGNIFTDVHTSTDV